MSSCSYKSRNTLFNTKDKIITDSVKTIYVVNNGNNKDSKTHLLQIDDIITIRNLQNPDLVTGISIGTASPVANLPYKVDVDSTVSLPVIGKVNLVGMSIAEAERRITYLYQTGPIKMTNPIFDISVVNLKVTVLGEVLKQGNYMLTKERTNLIEILGDAGGLSNRANKNTLQIIRGDLKNPEIFYVNLKDINTLSSDKLYLQNNDIIYVQPNRFALGADKLSSLSPFIQTVLILLNSALLISRFTN
jgi:polysaccharide export outer membrane protein